MEQLFAAFGINWKLLLVQGINFGLLLTVLWWFLYRPVLKIIDDRRKRIVEGVQAAEEANKKLADSKGEGDAILIGARREAERIIAAARERAKEKESEIVQGAHAKAEELYADAKARAEEEERAALRNSAKEITRAAVLAAEKILRTSA